ncbi:GntR family transcriptional regulator [Nocardiopsis sp. HNM0947]|uniref:GntR family transcriptional regulator n=1 Tax=Nocardiopsis coralli TaxID=2772213 RepID=A0ABR9P376_9ACTN|nr:GntR family transcriptional regulator [Nocardiopsis coralli]MBE2998257.1 GntR family transcriptional regulator [Nocardiopsis coralli]
MQIAEDLREQILQGTLPSGERVPSEAVLMSRYGVAQGTVRKAVTELRTWGLAETFHGRGTFVRGRPAVRRKSFDRFRRSHREAGQAAFLAETDQAGITADVRVLNIGSVSVAQEIALKLGVPEGSKVLERRRLYFADGVPVETAASYIPRELADAIPELASEQPGPGGIYARLEANGHRLSEFVEEVSARPGTKEEVSALSLGVGAPVIRLLRSAYDVGGRVIEVCDTVMAADRFVLEYRISADD